MIIERLENLSELPADAWNGLLPTHQPFMRHEFLSSLEASGSVGRRTGWKPSHYIVRDFEGTLRAAMPAYTKYHSYGEYVFDWAWADACHRAGIDYYPKLLSAVPFSPVGGARLLGEPDACVQLLLGLTGKLEGRGLSGLHINFTDSYADTLLAEQEGWLERLGCQFHWHNRGYRDFQDFLDALASRKRKQLRKEREQVAGQGIEFEWHDGASLREQSWDFVYACYANTYAVRGQEPYLTRAFFSELAARMPEAIRVVLALQAGRPVAMAFYLRDENILYGRYWGCLAEFDRLHFETCFYQGIDYAIREGITRFDAGAQGEHKLIRGFEPVLTRSWHYLVHPGLRTAVSQFLEDEREGIRRYAQAAAEALPFKQEDQAAL
ncbi:hypothetical protein IQ22_01607 [Pseudomonas duriflava]|uniref:N-acyltransferase n=1 Tax=Pseudomonas duriflava TaxID=459528 RepID=A0A562QG05_9PSED|nr:GNAT family N-acetyltransferase [Pseudomonas duriflava]TWI55674.1 hypothetical protein IQ22_01607 [Pseudomonas duriflava]